MCEMANTNVQELLCYHCLTASLDPNPISEIDKTVNQLRVRYKTYVVELDVEYGAVVLPNMFGHEFGDQIDREARLVDPNFNEFEVLVERHNGGIFLTKGWHALRDFYNVALGAWVTMVFVGPGKFVINLKDMFDKLTVCPKFSPPMMFQIEKHVIHFHLFDVVPSSWVHDEMNFQFSYEKRLTNDEIETGFLWLAYQGFCEATLDRGVRYIKLVDDCGNMWFCTLMYGTCGGSRFKIGGEWKRMVLGKQLYQGLKIMVGVPEAGRNNPIYFRVIRD